MRISFEYVYIEHHCLGYQNDGASVQFDNKYSHKAPKLSTPSPSAVIQLSLIPDTCLRYSEAENIKLHWNLYNNFIDI